MYNQDGFLDSFPLKYPSQSHILENLFCIFQILARFCDDDTKASKKVVDSIKALNIKYSMPDYLSFNKLFFFLSSKARFQIHLIKLFLLYVIFQPGTMLNTIFIDKLMLSVVLDKIKIARIMTGHYIKDY